ncbi:tyrosine-type recombinase/integrase [Halovibrio sp. HP20-50]|uniref:tyrosine-type recombinase/integrase n=1 Tax=Halovibrio sp. HP20-59 TaxID=3080275 RepID=UPI00294AE715|nr:tyrosine-type recombinase/integrase [Halovibrio sp. HP20-59]MEA2120090.1 tyrosine-type recombinase/integrase [Halovibrio sp. HP20-59]
MPKQKLSQQFVERTTPPEAGKVDYFDTETSGLSLKVLSSGTKTFSCRYRDLRGKQVERKLGSARVLKLSEARKRVLDIQAKLAMGEDPFETRRTLKQVPTFGAFVAAHYMPYIKGYKRSWATDETLLRNHVLPKLDKLYLDEIKRQHMIEVFSHHRETHEPASTNRVLILCRYIFNLALKWEVEGVTRNPTAGIELYPVNNQRERYLKDDEALRLFEALEASPNPLLPYIVAMLLLTGARKREVLNAKWQDFDLEQRLWRIEFNKTGKTRHVPLSQGALTLLSKLPRMEDNAYLFPNPKTGKPFIAIFNSWDTARNKAGLKDVRIHDLRHSFASYVINKGHSLYEVQKLLGHTQVKTTQRYAHLSHDSLLNAADAATASVPWDREAREDGEKTQALPGAKRKHSARQRALSRDAPRQTVSPPSSGEPPDGESST